MHIIYLLLLFSVVDGMYIITSPDYYYLNEQVYKIYVPESTEPCVDSVAIYFCLKTECISENEMQSNQLSVTSNRKFGYIKDGNNQIQTNAKKIECVNLITDKIKNKYFEIKTFGQSVIFNSYHLQENLKHTTTTSTETNSWPFKSFLFHFIDDENDYCYISAILIETIYIILKKSNIDFSKFIKQKKRMNLFI
jgi:hypothetical protein